MQWNNGNGVITPGVVIEDGAGGKLGASGLPIAVNDVQNAAFQGVVPMTVGSTYAAQRSLGVLCSVAGNVAMILVDGSNLILPVNIGWQTFNFGVTAVAVSGTTATATYFNLK